MVAEGIQRQKTMEKEVNNNIRGNYMDRLGVNSRARDSVPDPNLNHRQSNRVSNVSTDTYNFDVRKSSNLVIQKD